MNQELLDWMLLLGRWAHITVAVTWIGTSIFFMWLDRSFVSNPNNNREGHIGDLWMVHGGGFYQVEKMLMGPTKVPGLLHWFKWESYWTWMTGMFLLVFTYYTGSGTYLLDPSISDLNFYQALALCLFSVFGSWFFYDFVWEREFVKTKPWLGHALTIAWFIFMTFLLCHTLSGRAAYIHIGAMLGTWMAGNVFMRIIPRQVKMVEATKKGEPVNIEWGLNAKNRSTHNTYFTLPVIFIMMSNHFPSTYGHELAALILLLLTGAGAFIRQYFILKDRDAITAKLIAFFGVALILLTVIISRDNSGGHEEMDSHQETIKTIKTHHPQNAVVMDESSEEFNGVINGSVFFEGKAPQGKELRLPGACAKQYPGTVYTDEVIVKNGKLENVFVRISKGLEGKIYNQVPETQVELDQKGCIYKPRVIAARVGQEVVFINSDPVFHNVKSISKNNRGFNLAMPRMNQRTSKSFSSAEIFLETKCSVHPWMNAYIAIVDHPFFDVTRGAGSFKISKIPPGKYTLEAWHEVYGTQVKNFEISNDEKKEINFTFKGE